MKYLFRPLYAALLLALPFATLAQTGVTIGANTAPNASAALDIISTTKGVLLPRVASATGVASPATGLIVFQTGAPAGYYYYDGTSWQQLATASGAAITASNGLTKTGQNVALGGSLTTPTTIAQAGNNLALTGGSVGIGTAAPATTLDVSGDFRVSTGSVNATLGTTGSGNANFSANVGQSFTLPVAASITSIRLVDGANSFSTTFQIYSGGGPSGTALLATPQPITFTANASTTVVLPTPLSLAAGIYTLYLSVGSNPIRYFNSGENYTGGNVYSGNSSIAPYDLDFTVAYTSGSATSALAVNAGGNVGIGTTGTPSQKLDVTGGSVKISTVGQGLIFPDNTTQTTAAVTATGADFIQNGTAQQATSNFNISGTGTVGGTLTAAAATVTGTTTTANAVVTTALTGSGATIGTVVGLGIRADGGLNLGQNTSGNNLYVGYSAGRDNTTGLTNHFVGVQAGERNTTGAYNFMEGAGAGQLTTTGGSNLYMGWLAGQVGNGDRNFAIGMQAGRANTASDNHFVGFYAGTGTNTGSRNTFEGNYAGVNNTSGGRNTFVGFQAGIDNSTGSNNFGFGHMAGPASGSGTLANAGAIGSNAKVSQDNSIVLGGTGTSAVSVGIGTTAPSQTLDVVGGNIKISTSGKGLIFPDATTQTTAAVTATGAGFIQNGTAQQATSNFNISGTGTVGGTLSAGGGVVVNSGGSNTGSIANGLRFNGPNAGEGLASKTNAGGNQSGLDFYTNSSARLSISNGGNVGIGTGATAPAKRLHVDANNDVLRIDNLAQVSASNSYLVIDNSGNVGKTVVENVAGQLVRLGFNGTNYFENTGNPAAAEAALRFDANASAASMGNAPNGAPNFINTVTGATIATGQAVAAGNGTLARTTDQITLPAGVYRVTVRLSGSYFVNSASGTVRSGFVKFIVNNNEYSLVETLTAYDNGVTTHAEVSDYLNLSTTSTVDFSVRFLRNFNLIDRLSPGTGNSYRSLLLIERVR